MDEKEKRQKQSNLGVLLFIIAVIAGLITVPQYISASDNDAGAAYVIMFYAFSFISLNRIKRNTRIVVFTLSSILSIATLSYITVKTNGHELSNVINMLIMAIVISGIVYVMQIHKKVKIDKIENQS